MGVIADGHQVAEVAGEAPIAVRLGDRKSLLATVAQATRKTPVRCGEGPGFVVNRILMSGAAEIWRAQQESGKSPQEVDQKIQESKALPMGPFFLADMTGLDTTLHVAQNMASSYGERFYVHPGMKELVEAGNYGQKSGKGFYEHGT